MLRRKNIELTSTAHTVLALSTECSKPRENSVQSAQLRLLHSVRSAQECTEDLSALSAECFWRSVFQTKCTVHKRPTSGPDEQKVVLNREFRVGGSSKRCLNGLERQWQVIMAKTNYFRGCLTFRQGAVCPFHIVECALKSSAQWCTVHSVQSAVKCFRF